MGRRVGRLQQASSAAVSTLLKIMVDPTAPASVRVRAADSVLNHAARAMEIEDLDARIAELERLSAPAQSGAGSEIIDITPVSVDDQPGSGGG